MGCRPPPPDGWGAPPRLPSEGDAVEAFVVVGGGEEARRVPVLLQLECRLVPLGGGAGGGGVGGRSVL